MKSLLFTYLLTYGGAAASLIRPFTGFLIYVCFAIIKPDELWPYTVPQGNYSRTIALALLAGWALSGFGSWRFGQARGVVYSLLGFLAWAVAAALLADDRAQAMLYLEDLGKIVLTVLIGATLLDSVGRLRQLAWVILLSVGYLAFEFNLSYLQGYNRIREEGFGGLDNNGIAILLDSCVGLSVFLGLGARAWWAKLTALGTAVLLIHGVFLSNSRGGMLALGVTGLVSFLLLPKRTWHFALFGLIFLAGARLAGDGVRERFASIFAEGGERDASMEDRKKLLGYALDSVGNRPLTGVGPNHWNRTVRREYGIPDNKATEVHNTWVQIAAELGLPGLALIASYYGLCALRLLPLAASRKDGREQESADMARMVISSVVGSVVACSFVTVESVEAPYYIALLGAGVLKLMPPTGPRGSTPDAHGRPLPPAASRQADSSHIPPRSA
jgi:O-antigen ligase